MAVYRLLFAVVVGLSLLCSAACAAAEPSATPQAAAAATVETADAGRLQETARPSPWETAAEVSRLRVRRPADDPARSAPVGEPERVPPPGAVAAPLPAGPPPNAVGLTLAELEAIALGNNPTLVQAAMQVRAATGRSLQAGLYPNPTLAYSGEEIGDEGTAGFQGAAFGQEIVTAGKLRLRSAVIAQEVQQAQCAWQAQRGRVLNDVRATYYEVLAAQRIVELNEQLVDIGQQGVRLAEDLLRAKEVSRVDALQARIEADSARVQLRSAQYRQEAVWRRLAALLGTPQMEPARLAGDLEQQPPQVTWEDTLARLWRESPELAQAEAGVRRARTAVDQQCAERISNLDLRGTVHYDNTTHFAIAGAEIGMALPFFNRNQGNICRAEAELVAAESETARIRLSLQERLAAAFEQYAAAGEEVARYAADILPNAKATLDLVSTGYRQGQFDYLTMLTAQRTYFRVNLAYLESLRQYQVSRTAIDGLLLSGGLQKVAGSETQ